MVNIYVISGFLGAGKTTFIKNFLKSLSNGKTVVLENEFGETSVDGDFIRNNGYQVVDIPEGCICCNLKIDFTDAIISILQDMEPNNIVIEPTGLGVLSEILKILYGKAFENKVIIKNVITLVDGENYLEQVDVFGEFFMDQIINAQNIIISKVDKITKDTLEAIVNSFEAINVKGNIFVEDLCKCEEQFFQDFINTKEEELKEFENLVLDEHSINASKEVNSFASISFEVKKQYSREELDKKLGSLKKLNAGKIIRAKGILTTNKSEGNNQAENLEFDYVNGVYEIRNSNINVSSKICVIGENLNKSRIKMTFNYIEITRLKQ